MELRKGKRLTARTARSCDVVTLIEPREDGWDCRVVWWWMRGGKWERQSAYPRVVRTTAELATYTGARYADPNRSE